MGAGRGKFPSPLFFDLVFPHTRGGVEILMRCEDRVGLGMACRVSETVVDSSP
jgi:hypothetical protein